MDDPFGIPPVPSLPRQRSRPNLNHSLPAPPSSRSLASQLDRSPSPTSRQRPIMSGLALRQHLSTLLDQKSSQLQMLGSMGQEILKQQQELEERVKEFGVDAEDNEEVDNATRSQLHELDNAMRDWDNQNESMMRELGGKPSGMIDGLPNSTMAAPAESSISRRQRNKERTLHDVEFTSDLSRNLIKECRRLQTLLSDRDQAISKLVEERDSWDTEKEGLIGAVRVAEGSVERYKEENWNLEVTLQDIRTKFTDVQDQYNKTSAEHARLSKTLVSTREMAEAHKTEAEKASQLLEEIKTKHETDMANARKATAGLQRDKSDLLSELNVERNRRVSAMRARISRGGSPSPGMLDVRQAEEEEEDVFGNGNESPKKRGPGFDVNGNALSPGDLYQSDFDSPNPTPSKPGDRDRKPLGDMFINEIDELRGNLEEARAEISRLKAELEAAALNQGRQTPSASVENLIQHTPEGLWEEDGSIGARGKNVSTIRGRRGRGRGFAASLGRKLGFNRTPSSLSASPGTPAGDRSFNSASSGTPDLLRQRGATTIDSPISAQSVSPSPTAMLDKSSDSGSSEELSQKDSHAPTNALADELGDLEPESATDVDWSAVRHTGNHYSPVPELLTTTASSGSIASAEVETPKRIVFGESTRLNIQGSPAPSAGETTPTKKTIG